MITNRSHFTLMPIQGQSVQDSSKPDEQANQGSANLSSRSGAKNVADILFQEGVINKDQYDRVVFEAARQRKNVEDIIEEMGLVPEDQLVKARSMLYGIPFADLTTLLVPREALSLLDKQTALAHQAIPFAITPEGVSVAMVDPLNIQSLRFLEHKIGKRVIGYMTTEAQFQEAVDRLYGEALEKEVSEVVTEAVEEAREVLEIGETEKETVEEDITKAPVAKMINILLQSAVRMKASDIHIEPQKDYLRVRFRINGMLSEQLKLPLSVAPSLISRIKILAKLKIDVKRKPQDGRFYIRVKGGEIDLRVSTLPTIFGEKVVIRLLRQTGGLMKLEETGLRGSGMMVYLDAISAANGIILITGPTGSGKTATLAASIARINKPTVNIVTLEDPVEIKIPGVNQVQINPAAGLTFANGLRSILRQDPNIIMVGEIRDEETARLATQAALTGHLVFSTLHTNSAAGALPRLLDMNIEGYLVASTVRVVVGQRLIRTLCQSCREAYPATNEILADIQMKLTGIKEFNLEEFIRRNGKDGKLILYKPKGCPKCNNTGFFGRTGIFEVLKVSDTIGQMVMQHRTASDIETEAKKEGMITMVQDGYLKALEGITSIEEVLRVTKV